MASRALTNEEIEQALLNTTRLQHRCLFILGIRTGFRISELLSLTIKDVLHEGIVLDEITVRRTNMKGKGRSRSVKLHNQAKEAIKEYLESNSRLDGTLLEQWSVFHPTEPLFSISRFTAHRIIKTIAQDAGLKGRISCHSMRKTFGMRVYEKTGKDIVAAQRALGHASLASTTKYLTVDQDIIDDAILSD